MEDTKLYTKFNNIKIQEHLEASKRNNVLDLTRNSIFTIDIFEVLDISHLRKINISENRITSINALVSVIPSIPNLRSLNLSSNKIKDISRLFKVLEFNSSIEDIDLERNRIEDVSEIRRLSTNTKLVSIDLDGNFIENISFDFLKKNRTLENLSVARNKIRQDIFTQIRELLTDNKIVCDIEWDNKFYPPGISVRVQNGMSSRALANRKRYKENKKKLEYLNSLPAFIGIERKTREFLL